MLKQTFFISLALSLGTCLPMMAQTMLEATPGTLQQTLQKVKKLTKNQKDDIVVAMHGGTYELSSPMFIDEQLSGRNGKKVIFRAVKGETPIISGGKTVTGWTRVTGNLWKAPLSCDHKVRQMFVDGQRARMAQAKVLSDGGGVESTFTITGNEPWAFGAGEGVDGIKLVMNSELAMFRNPEDVEIVQNKVWTEKVLCARDFDKWGDTLVVRLQQPAGAILNSMAWAGRIDYTGKFFVRNAYELLDEPGEFYFDRTKQTLFYMAPDGMDMTKSEVVVPVTEGLLRVHGKSLASRAGNVTFEGITFSYDAWNLMEVEGSRGFGGIQSLGLAVKYIPDGNWHPTKYNSCDTPMGTVDVQNATGVNFERCRFEHLGAASAVTLMNDVTNSSVNACFFNDALGNAVAVGHPQHYEIGDGEGRYSNAVEGVCRDINITNNYVRNVSLDFRQVEAMVGFFVNTVKFDHNDIQGVPYGAIALGWWWGNAKTPESTVAANNSISFNRLGNSHQLLSDGGIVYMLGRQPGSVIEYNYLFKGPRCIYPDDGSSGWYIHDNVINSAGQLWFHIDSDRDYDIRTDNNYVKANSVANSGINTPITNTHTYRNVDFSDEAKAIMDASGIEEKYKDIIPAQEPEKISISRDFKIKKW